ncbi:biosynthetic arginine decarboxylase [Gayadomonas joobiniege]|uniref:biosynthetic arginine decarboxylase n=1 Tax=Gayadomonas joobiniege TaxID=1234606 RepID=UPI00037F979B|nr:biosynthetic arginine decarboxylase [Gayadomonas joobiniege]
MSVKNTEHAKQIYNINNWSDGYFDINQHGEVVAQPKGQPAQQVPFTQIIQSLQEAGLRLPVLLRFTDILSDRVVNLHNAFEHAIKQHHYQGCYTPVYPIKVNQQHSVVEQLLTSPVELGLEAGSKAELLAILGSSTKKLTIVCNGYKDLEFLQLAIAGQQMGHQVHVVIEKVSELKLLLAASEQMQACPIIGIRIRLNSTGRGRWQNSGGEKGKFGLTAEQLLQAIELIKKADKLAYFNMVHFHIGSQIANIRDIQIAIRECARYYAELRLMQVPINLVDVGGGLGVDYEGSGSRSHCSTNYDMHEYARNIVAGLNEVCQQYQLPHPDIITESGRAMTAHHAVLITNLIDQEAPTQKLPPFKLAADAPSETQEMAALVNHLSPRNALEVYHDAVHYFSEAQQKFTLGLYSLSHWAELEGLYFSVLALVRQQLDNKARAHRLIKDELDEKLAIKMFANFSLFQSLPDAWGIQQIFPVLPLSQLDQPLTQRAIIQDITCDSDGQIKQYADGMGTETSLPVPPYRPETPYYLGMFMLGAYQEILGDMHNLFGDTDSAHIEFNARGQLKINRILHGDTAESVLATVHFQKNSLLEMYQQHLAASQLTDEQKDALYLLLKNGLEGYTYFEN